MEQGKLTVVIEMVKGPLTIPGSVPRDRRMVDLDVIWHYWNIPWDVTVTEHDKTYKLCNDPLHLFESVQLAPWLDRVNAVATEGLLVTRILMCTLRTLIYCF